MTFTGRGFTSEGTIVNVGGGGIRIELPFLEVTEQSLTVWFAIYADAIPGQRFISLTTAAGTTSALPFTIGAPLPAIGSFAANPRIINVAASSTLSWTGITNATRCSINNGVGDVPCGNSSVVVSPQATTEYMLSAVGPGGREWTYQTVAVEPGRTTYSQAFAFTGASQTFTVPEGVTSITIEASGAQGGTGLSSGLAGGAAGLGSTTRATLSVTPGAVYQVNVGGQGTNGTAGVGGGGAGGGASDVRTGGNTLNDRVIVAGGGGGGGLGSGGFGTGGAGGDGGGLTGASGNDTSTGAGGGGGGTQGAGGSGGGGGSAGAAGTVGQGGLAGGTSGNTAGGFNGGGNGRVAGGGGGGYYGGGGGGQANTGAGGGGGSSFAISSATNVTHQRGGRAGNGVVTISWQ